MKINEPIFYAGLTTLNVGLAMKAVEIKEKHDNRDKVEIRGKTYVNNADKRK